MIDKLIDSVLGTMEGQFSIILKELNSGTVLYVKDIDRQLPSASTIKILIMLEAYNQVQQGKLDLAQRIRVNREDKVAYSLITDMSTDEYVLKDLIILMMSISDNTATNILIDLLGMEAINGTGKSIGLADTSLRRKMMDFEAAKAGRQNITSPTDMHKLMEKLYRGEVLTAEACKEMLDIMSIAVGREFIIRYLPEEVKVSHKTGELDGLNHDIGIIYTRKGDYILGIFATGLRDNIYGRECIAVLSKCIYEELIR